MFDILVASKPRTLETAHQTAMAIAVHKLLLSMMIVASVGTAGIFGSAAYDLAWPKAPIAKVTPLGARNPNPVTLGPDYLQLGRRYTRWLQNGLADSLAAVMTGEALERIGGVDGLRHRMGEIAAQFGYETRYLGDGILRDQSVNEFYRDGNYSRLDNGTLRIEWQFDELGRIRSGEISQKQRPVLR